MKIVQINSVTNGSTGKIMMSIHNNLLKKGYDSHVVWGRGRKSTSNYEFYLNDKAGVYFHTLYTRLTGKNGFASKKSTKKLINYLDYINPDIVHLHNIHGYYLNIELLFNYFKRKKIKIIWTFHDCWPFTGQCPFFTLKKCQKWKKECFDCKMISEYPKTISDNSKWNYNKKKDLFNGLDITIVTPSKWLASLVKESFLKDYQVEIINNGIDLSIFKPTHINFKKRYNIENKKIILGVAGVWDSRKGLDDFIKLSKIIDDSYIIVLIGLSQKQIKNLPSNIIGIERTENQNELAGIYSESDILFNPTYEDNYPTVNIESIACGTPVLTYNTGGSPESACYFGKVVSLNEMLNNYDSIINEKFQKRVDNNIFSEHNMCEKYIELYEKIAGD